MPLRQASDHLQEMFSALPKLPNGRRHLQGPARLGVASCSMFRGGTEYDSEESMNDGLIDFLSLFSFRLHPASNNSKAVLFVENLDCRKVTFGEFLLRSPPH